MKFQAKCQNIFSLTENFAAVWNLQADRTKNCNSDNRSLFSVRQGWLRNS